MTPYEVEVLARLEELSSNVAQIGSWVAVAAFAAAFACGVAILRLILWAKNQGKVW